MPLQDARLCALRTMLPRATGFRRYLAELYDEPEDLENLFEDEVSLLDVFYDYLRDEVGIEVRADGLSTFRCLDTQTERLIGNLPVLIFHHTSDAVIPSIMEVGLIPTETDVSRWGKPCAGVYVTTECSGPAVDGYRRRAVAVHGGEEWTIGIKSTLGLLKPDPDDDDITSGKFQFVLPEVPVEDLLLNLDMGIDDHVFHVTFNGRLDAIDDRGLQPGNVRAIGAPCHDAHCRGNLFFSEAARLDFWHTRAVEFAEQNSDDHLADGQIPVVLRVPAQAVPLTHDAPGSNDSRGECYRTTFGVPSELIQIWTGRRWTPLATRDRMDRVIRDALDEEGWFRKDSELLPGEGSRGLPAGVDKTTTSHGLALSAEEASAPARGIAVIEKLLTGTPDTPTGPACFD